MKYPFLLMRYKNRDVYIVTGADWLVAGQKYKRGEIFIPPLEVAEGWRYGNSKPSCAKNMKGIFWKVQNISGFDIGKFKKDDKKIVDERFIEGYKKMKKVKKKHYKILSKFKSNF